MKRMALAVAVLMAVALMAAVPSSAEAAGVRTWNRIAMCESGGRWHINTGNGYYGGLQISLPTWRGYGGRRYASYPHRASKWHQIVIANRILRGQGWGAWPTCARRLGLL